MEAPFDFQNRCFEVTILEFELVAAAAATDSSTIEGSLPLYLRYGWTVGFEMSIHRFESVMAVAGTDSPSIARGVRRGWPGTFGEQTCLPGGSERSASKGAMYIIKHIGNCDTIRTSRNAPL